MQEAKIRFCLFEDLQVANRSCCICLRNVRLESFLHLPLQQLLLKRWQGSALTWRGPGGAAACSGASAADGAGVSCSVVGDTGGDMNAACLQNDGIMILKVCGLIKMLKELVNMLKCLDMIFSCIGRIVAHSEWP